MYKLSKEIVVQTPPIVANGLCLALVILEEELQSMKVWITLIIYKHVIEVNVSIMYSLNTNPHNA